jgi:hypothetical protein
MITADVQSNIFQTEFLKSVSGVLLNIDENLGISSEDEVEPTLETSYMKYTADNGQCPT